MAIVRHNAAPCYPHIFKVCCCAFSAAWIVASIKCSRKGTSARVCLSGKQICISWDFTEIPDPDLSLQAAIQDALKCNKRQTLQMYMQQMSLLTQYAKEVKFFFFFFKSVPLKNKVALVLRWRELACFDKFLELRSNEVSPYMANVEGSEIPQEEFFHLPI